MRLEDLRGLHVGDLALFLPQREAPISAAFHHHAEQAQWHTVNCLVRLSGNPVDGVANERIAVVEWWRTIESLIALVHLVALFESDADLRPSMPRIVRSKRDGVLDRWSAIGRWFSDGRDSPPKQLTGRVKELRDFRNSFEHTSRDATISVRYSRLATVPGQANLSDAMEAMAICVEASAFLREVLAGVDLMPQCVVPSKHHLFYVPLDVLARDLLFPQYARLVAALGLDTDVRLYQAARHLRGGSLVAPAVAVKAEPGSADVQSPQPLDLWTAFEAFVDGQPGRPSPEEFGLPAYQRHV